MSRRNRRSYLRSLQWLLLGLLSCPLLAQTAVPGDTPPPPAAKVASPAASTPPLADSSVRLADGDLIEIGVFGVPDLSTKVRISNSGDVYLPLIDYVHIADLSVDEAQKLIEKRLQDGGFVRGPHVTIFVD